MASTRLLSRAALLLAIVAGCQRFEPANQTELPSSLTVDPAEAPAVGTWTTLPANPINNGANSMTLLTDGSVLVNSSGDWHQWTRFVPNASGSYVNGTWSQVASSARGRLYYPSFVMRDGRVFVSGGEYIQDSDGNTNQTEIYDPLANTWSAGPAGLFGDIADVSCAMLADGRIFLGHRFSAQTQLYTPSTNAFTAAASMILGDTGSEGNWTLLGDGSVFGSIRSSQRYLPDTNEWVAAAPAPVQLSFDFEHGPVVQLQDGRVFVVSDRELTAIYTPPTTLTGPGSWTTGPSLPGGLYGDDVPAALLPDGKVLTEATLGQFGNLSLFEFDPTNNTYASVPSPIPPTVGYSTRMLTLPNGQVMFSGGGGFFVYNPTGAPQDAWRPIVDSVTPNPDGSYTVSGTQLNGRSFGSVYGDDAMMNSNYPVVYLTDAANHVFYARSFDFSTMGIRTGSTPVSAKFRLPAGLANGTYNLFVSAAGISSATAVPLTIGGGGNTAPTVVNAALATPNPVAGTNTALSVLGADDEGEAALKYTWSATGPAPVTFSANGTNGAKNSTANFTKAGSYNVLAVIQDTGGLTVSSAVAVTVSQTLTTVAVSPVSATVQVNATQQFTASGTDQFGAAVSPSPTFTWTVSGGGTIDSASGLFTAGTTAGGPFTVTATSGGKSGMASVTVTSGSTTSTLGPIADAHVRGGSHSAETLGTLTTLEVKQTTTTPDNVRRTFLKFDLSGVTGTVSAAKLRLFGSHPTNSAALSAYAVASNNWSETTINFSNQPMLGAKQGASVSVTTTAAYREWDVGAFVAAQKGAGINVVSLAVTMDATNDAGPAVFNSRENGSNKPQLVVTAGGGGSNAAPTVEAAALATPNPVVGTTTALSVLGADDGGEAALKYTWSATGPAAVTFSTNGSNAAKNCTATFTKAGSYSVQAVIQDAGGLTATSSVAVTVNQTLTTIVVSPATASVQVSTTRQFTASAADQFGATISPAPTFTWTVSGGGTIGSGTGLFTAGTTAGGPFTVTATSGGKSGTASVTVVSGSTTTTLGATADAYVRDGSNAAVNFGLDPALVVKNSTVTGNHRRSFLMFSVSGIAGSISSAKLRIFGSSPLGTRSDSASAVTSNSWTETGITWNNQPTLGAKQGASVGITTTAKYYEFDVTAFVQAQKAAGINTVSLAITQDQANNDTPDTFNSRQAASNKPQLVVISQ
jgi:hypothetical protein